jgi:ribosomal protein S18 acetylase RimI-like enzyme
MAGRWLIPKLLAVEEEAAMSQPDERKRDLFNRLAEANFGAYIVTIPGAEVVDASHYLRVRTPIPFAYLNAIVCRALPTGAVLDTLIAETRAFYAAQGSPYSWYVTPFTSPADTGKTLAARGLVRQEQVNMAIDLAALPETVRLPTGCTIEEVWGAERFDEWGRTYVTGYEMPPAMAAGALATLGRMPSGPDTPLRRYLARLDGVPVASATLFMGGGAAGIYNVATLPPARGRGIAAAVTLAALREAEAQGETVGVLHASEMAYSVYRRMGFVESCVWDCYREPRPA